MLHYHSVHISLCFEIKQYYHSPVQLNENIIVELRQDRSYERQKVAIQVI